ncbi:hypothetical protein [Fluoribacter gormanii]|uniref:non-homologous end-joining DNA ligase LigD n=1 Tax=Fluoribacter gormanii TaxID=464 RepID=UPI0032C461CF
MTILEQRKNMRENKAFIDFLQNDYDMTAVVPYSLQAIKGVQVSYRENNEVK